MSREIFTKNLNELVDAQQSRSACARAIGINRSQLLRYMSGSGVPAFDQLEVIFEYFDVDARIMSKPLAEIRAEKQGITETKQPQKKEK